MKQRVTLTIDAKVLRRARRLAHERHTSVSQLIEDLLSRAVDASARASEDFTEKWAGKLTLSPRDRTDPRREYLWRKYGLANHAHSD